MLALGIRMGHNNTKLPVNEDDKPMSDEEKQLHLAIIANQRPLVRALINESINVDKRWNIETDGISAKVGMTPLVRAVSLNYVDITKMLLEADASVNKTDSFGRTPLYKAAFHGRTRLIDILIKAGSRVNLSDHNGQTPLYICVYNSVVHSNCDAVRRLLHAFANVDRLDLDGVGPIHVSCQWKRPQTLRLLIDAGGDLNCVDKLFDADLALILPCLRILYSYGADMLNLIDYLHFKSSAGIPDDILYGQFAESDTPVLIRRFAVWYKTQCCDPPSLAQISRYTIQGQIKRDDQFTRSVNTLPTPKRIRKFLSRKLFFPRDVRLPLVMDDEDDDFKRVNSYSFASSCIGRGCNWE